MTAKYEIQTEQSRYYVEASSQQSANSKGKKIAKFYNEKFIKAVKI